MRPSKRNGGGGGSLQHPFVAGIDPRVHAKVLKSLVRRCKDAAADRDADHVRRVSEIAEMEPPPSHPRGRSDGDMTESNGSHGVR